MSGRVRDFRVRPAAGDPTLLEKANQKRNLLETGVEHPSKDSFAALLSDLGEALFRLAFANPNQVAAFAGRLSTAVRGKDTLRLWVRAKTPELATLPWEYLRLTDEAVEACRGRNLDLRDEHRFLALHPSVSIVRQASRNPTAAQTEEVDVVRVLIAWANPASGGWHDVGVAIDAQLKAIRDGLAWDTQDHLDVRWIRHATKKKLSRAMRAWKPHVVHFACHGAYPGVDDPGDLGNQASLVLEAGPVGHEYLPAGELRGLCAESRCRLVVLNSCLSAKTEPRFTGIAQVLTDPGGPGDPVPAVVGMQLWILTGAALEFAGSLYQQLALARTVEESVDTFRKDVARNHEWGAGVPEWGIPAVFLGAKSSALFRGKPSRQPLDFGPLIREHVPIIGREFLREDIEAFLENNESGVYLLTAAPGLGKTAFAAQWVEDERNAGNAPVHFFFRATGGINDPDECVRALYRGLLSKHRVQEKKRAETPVEQRRMLEELIERISREHLKPGQREVLVIDALDEAGNTAYDRRGILGVLPARFPRGVFLLSPPLGPCPWGRR